MNWQVILGLVLLIPSIYLGVGLFCSLALSGAMDWFFSLLEWVIPAVVIGAAIASAAGGVWLICRGLA